MKAIVITAYDDPEPLQLQDVPDPVPKDHEVLIKITASALNRADTLQKRGLHHPPRGSIPIPGVEASGIVETVGKDVSRWKVGDQVCCLVYDGGYAEKVAAPAAQVLPVPAGVSLKDAAAFPEVACTVWSTVFMKSRLSAGESFLVHGGSSGIGTFAIQIAKYQGARVFVTAGSDEKLASCKNLGADVCINYKTEDFVARVKEETGGKGVDVILDIMGAPYFKKNLESLNYDGRLFVIGTIGGSVTELDLRALFPKRLTVQAAGLRLRCPENKALVVSEVEKNVWPAIAAGKVKPVVYKTFQLSEAAEAQQLLETSSHIGKILLIP
ncbi:Quinone oxidoreductase PIG [Parasponia andersonii]|uniref:Quinone oxidoreductase PIG n=1 Tax=Parasponia andersonii TaxID=3476 RepID=A0A2P5DCF9_PARAD|nr:Quinone oxidoreductase PIG [Parasponia andersonii]